MTDVHEIVTALVAKLGDNGVIILEHLSEVYALGYKTGYDNGVTDTKQTIGRDLLDIKVVPAASSTASEISLDTKVWGIIGLSARVSGALARYLQHSGDDVLFGDIMSATAQDIRDVRGMGPSALRELSFWLRSVGYPRDDLY